MTTLRLKAHIRADGTLDLHVPTDLPEGEVEVTLQIHPLASKGRPWPNGYFERTFGQWVGELERPPQGEFETREVLDEVSA